MHTTQFSSQQNLKEAASVNPPPPSKAPTVLLDAISAYTDKKKKPKRNRSAFILFSIDIRKKTQQENLDILNPNDKFVKIAQLWKELSDEERKVYEERAREEKERYASELSSFCKSFPSEPIQRPRNHIKKPCNAYGYYLKDVKEAIRKESPELRMCEVLRIVGERWKKLSSEDRQKYEKKAEVSRKKFKAEITKQNNANKKANVLKRETTANKGKDDQTSDTKGLDDDNLLRMDPIVLKNERAEKKETQGLYEPPIQKMQKLEQENIRPNTQQQRQPLMPTPRNTNMLDDLNSNLSLLLGNDAFSEAFTHDTDESSASSNTMTLQALQNLLGKVENLRHHILIQMHLVSNKEQSLLFPSNLDYLTLLELAQNATPDFRVIPGLQSGGQEYRKREF